MEKVASLSNIIDFIKEHAKGTHAFKNWNMEGNDERLWICLLSSSGNIFTVHENDVLVAVAFVLPKERDNEYHLCQILALERRYVKELYLSFRRKHPKGIIRTGFRRGRLVTYKDEKRLHKQVLSFK